ncbi:MAG: excinuclease ABC subunit A [Bacteroidetes bacterium 4484_249]|nr:MAG: excinuclease ABC subunit A [Bacteroidetes bacterium 4484_249]
MLTKDISTYDSREYIIIKGAKVHNLKNIDIAIPKNKFIVITGLSGSGKSSLAFDTLFADGQRRYVESLSSYARQFLGRMSKPEVDYIKGIAPAIAIEQKVNTRNPRSTVGTSTEIYEYLKLLFARVGKTYSPVSGKLVERHTVSMVTDFVVSQNTGTKILIYSLLEINNKARSVKEQLSVLLQQGFSRIKINGDIIRIDKALETQLPSKKEIFVVIDRIIINKKDGDLASRVADSVQTAFYEGHGVCSIDVDNNEEIITKTFSNKFEADGISFEEPTVNLFSFNNPFGACKSCEGFGNVIGIDPDLVIPNKSLSVYEEAIVCWKGEKMSEWKDLLIKNAYKFDFPVHKPVYELTKEHRELLWKGNEYFSGLDDFFKYVEEQTYKIQYRVMLSRYRGKTICPECNGTRLRKDANYVKVGGKSISEVVLMPVTEAINFFKNIKLNEFEEKVATRLLIEIKNRLHYLSDVGLGYLTLNRLSNSLSGGESQRINLATSLGSSLVGSIYILDEPSIGLHPRDTHRLIKVLKQLRNSGNTVIVVEHDEEIIKAADEIIDIGPKAGLNGGKLIFQGGFEELINSEESLTAKYLTGRLSIKLPERRRNWKEFIEITGARENNLKSINVRFPLNTLTIITGVSGSGKTSLVKNILYPALRKMFGGYGEKTGKFDKITGDINRISNIEFIDQNPIGRSSRSNPATYVKAYDDIRTLYASQPLSKIRGYKPGFFSFNIEGGRCEECEGEGVVKIEMQFMADIYLTCENCDGKRYKDEVLDIKFQEKNISDILNMTINETIDFFTSCPKPTSSIRKIVEKLKPLQDTGLGYLGVGQPSSTLSGGEAQRVKLAYFLSKGAGNSPTLFIFDEPTTGLHFHDISKLLSAFNALIEKGHSIIVIEHNMEVIKCADWIIDLGKEGGDNGGNVVFEGVPEDLVKIDNSYTARYLKEKLPVK